MKHISKISVASTVIAGTGKKISTVFGRVPGGEEAVEEAFNASSSSRRQVTKRTDHPRGFIFEEDFVPRSRLSSPLLSLEGQLAILTIRRFSEDHWHAPFASCVHPHPKDNSSKYTLSPAPKKRSTA